MRLNLRASCFICLEILSLLLFAGRRVASAQGKVSTTLTVSVAASLTESIQEVEAAYHREHPEVQFRNTFGASGMLSRQIEQGAPVDIFLSAAEKPVRELVGQGLVVSGSNFDLLRNQLVLIVPRDSKVTSLQQLSTARINAFAMGDPQSVPAGQYGEQALRNLNLLNTVRPHIVYGKDVRQVLTFVATGNAEAGIVYATDAMSSKNVRVAQKISESLHDPIIYPAALIANRPNTASARAFLQYLHGATARAIWNRYGFIL